MRHAHAKEVSLREAFNRFLPIELAMTELVPSKPQSDEIISAAGFLVNNIQEAPTLQSAVWLYVDELDRSHSISQNVHTNEGSLWHAVMHRREGDFWNSKYWLRQATDLSVLREVYGDPSAFVDRVERAHAQNPAELIELQRLEWSALFNHCAKLAGLRGLD